MPVRRLWTDTFIDETTASGTQDEIDLTSTFLTNEMRLAQLTLVRTIIRLDIAYSVHDAGEGSQQATAGICVVSRPALSGGTATMPNPNDANAYPTRPWVWRTRNRVFGFAADQPAIDVVKIDLDIRSQRKLENGELEFLCANVPEEGVATTLLFSGLIRCLFLVT